MTHTAVQELSEPTLACRVAFGTPARSMAGARGTIALFSPGSMVAYLIENRGKFAFFVFRTLAERQVVGARIEWQGARASVADDARGTDPEGIRNAFFMGVSPRNPAK